MQCVNRTCQTLQSSAARRQEWADDDHPRAGPGHLGHDQSTAHTFAEPEMHFKLKLPIYYTKLLFYIILFKQCCQLMLHRPPFRYKHRLLFRPLGWTRKPNHNPWRLASAKRGHPHTFPHSSITLVTDVGLLVLTNKPFISLKILFTWDWGQWILDNHSYKSPLTQLSVLI